MRAFVLILSFVASIVHCGIVKRGNNLQFSDSVFHLSNKLFNSLVENDDYDSNVVLSPMSIHFALSMLQRGAHGTTKQKIRNFMNLNEELEDVDIDTANRILLKTYASKAKQFNESVELANLLVVDEELDINEIFVKKLEEFYFSNIKEVDFSQPEESARLINNWVANKTENLIKEFLSPDAISDDSRLVLLNAIYFKANWMKSFNKFDTYSQVFNINQEKQLNVDMMYQQETFSFAENDKLDCQVLDMPYEDENFSMLIFLPNQSGSEPLNRIIKNLEYRDITRILKDMKEKVMSVSLPKFTVGYKSQLRDTLMTLGMTHVFENADFSGIAQEYLEANDFLHEAKVEVYESGSEASGVTGISLGIRSGVSAKEFNANRPFVFMIIDKESEVPLFVGKIVHPTESTKSSPLGVEIGVRQNDPESLLDPEDRSHMEKNPELFVKQQTVNCTPIENYVNSEMVKFPCPPNDTRPIEDYHRKFGDASELGINGELADLKGIKH